MFAEVKPKTNVATGAPKAQSGTRPAQGALENRPAALRAGEMVDHFRVERLIGMGGMGAVYVAQDSKLGRPVALKVVQPGVLGSADAVERFIYEAQTTAKLNHPHIVTIYAVGDYQGQPYVALELVEGKSLEEQLDEALPTLPDALSIALSITEAVATAHEHGVLHRDLKPANVVVPPDGRLRVLDFGLAKRMVDNEGPRSRAFEGKVEPKETYAGAGTPAYMAPEQWVVEASSPGTDVWAIGLIVFELCTGRLPYDEEFAMKLATMVCSPEPAPRLDSFAEVPTALADLVARCLEKIPDDRPSANEVKEALTSIRAQLSDNQASPSKGARETVDPSERDPSLRDTEFAPTTDDSEESPPPAPNLRPGANRWLWALPLAISVVVLWLGRDALLNSLAPSSPVATATSAAPSQSPVPTAAITSTAATLVPTAPNASASAAPSASSPQASATPSKSPAPPLKATTRAPARATAPSTLPPYDSTAAARLLRRQAGAAGKACKHPGAPRIVSVFVTFESSGAGTKVKVLPHAPTSTAQCVAGFFQGLRVPAFSPSGGSLRVANTVVRLR